MWLVSTKTENKQMHCQITPRRACNPCGYTMKLSSKYRRLLIYDVYARLCVWCEYHYSSIVILTL